MSIVKGKEPVVEENEEMEISNNLKNSHIDDNAPVLNEHTEKDSVNIEICDYERKFLETFKGYESDYPVKIVNNDEVLEIPIFIVAKILPLAEMLDDIGEIPEDPIPFKFMNKELLDIAIHFYSLKTNSGRKKFISEGLLKNQDKIIEALKNKSFKTKDEYCKYAREVCSEYEEMCNKIDACCFGGKGDTDFTLLSEHGYWDIDDEPLMGLFKIIQLLISKFMEQVLNESMKDKFWEDPNDKLTITFAKEKLVEEKLTDEQIDEIEYDNGQGEIYTEILEGIDEDGNTYKYIIKEVPTDEYYVHDTYEPKKRDFPTKILREYFGHDHLYTYNNYIEEARINDLLDN